MLQQLPTSTDARLFVVMPDTLTNWLGRRTTSLGIVDLHWHDTRHEALRRFAEMKGGIVQISASSGHQELETLQRYLHPSNIHVDRDSVTGKLLTKLIIDVLEKSQDPALFWLSWQSAIIV